MNIKWLKLALIDFGISTDKLFMEREVPFFDSRLGPVITKVRFFSSNIQVQ